MNGECYKMAIIYNETTVKKIIYDGTAIKKGYCDGVNVFTSDHVVTYQIKGQTWTATVEDGDEAMTADANDIASGKMGSGDTFLGWTTISGSTSPMSSIPANEDGIILYGIWKHTHIGSNTVRGGCYQGTATSVRNHYIDSMTPVVYDSCGCSHNSWVVHCSMCGASWTVECQNSMGCTNTPKHQNGACTYPGQRTNCPNGHPDISTQYGISCGKTAGTFCG